MSNTCYILFSYTFHVILPCYKFVFQHGITQANELVNLTEFFVNHILPDLKSANGKFCKKLFIQHHTCNIYLQFLKIDLRKRKKTPTCCSTYFYIHWLLFVCTFTRYWTCNLGIVGLRSNQLELPKEVTLWQKSYHYSGAPYHCSTPNIGSCACCRCFFYWIKTQIIIQILLRWN